MSIWRYNGNGNWGKIRSIFRYNGDGVWARVKSVWRYNGSGFWGKVFGLANPYPSSIDGPQLWFIESPYTSSANKSIDANQITGAAFQNSKMYIQRGKWEEDPIYFEVRIQKKDSGGTWGVINPPGINTARFSYLANQEYSDADYTKIWPADSANWPTISLQDIKNKTVFRAKFRVSQTTDPTDTELDQLEFHFPGDNGIAPRLAFALNPYADGELSEDEDSSIPALKVLSLRWRYNTSFFPVTEASQVIGKQILEVKDFNGNRVLGPFDVEVNNFNPQTRSINYTQAMIDSGEQYSINLYVVANDYYYQSGYSLDQHINSSDETIQLYSLAWQPPVVVNDPTVTITNRTKNSFNAEWYSTNAERYDVDVYNSTTSSSIIGYPIFTTNTSALVSGLTQNTLYSIDVTGMIGTLNEFKSNTITKSVRTLTDGIPAVLSNPFNITASSFQTRIQNLTEIEDFDIQINLTSGNFSLSGDVITVSGITQGVESCVSITTSKINNTDLTVQSFDIAQSNQVCHTANTWYCKTTTPEGGCNITIETYDKTLNGSGFNTVCSTDQNFIGQCCTAGTVWGEWEDVAIISDSGWSTCSNGLQTRTQEIYQERTGTTTAQNCSTSTTFESRNTTRTLSRGCVYYCTLSVTENCAGCTYSEEANNISFNGSGYSISCSTSGYPNCATPCNPCTAGTAWEEWEDVSIDSESPWSTCSNGTRTRTQTVYQERTGTITYSDCSTGTAFESQTITRTISGACSWYCTTSVSQNCAGCTYSEEANNISQSGSGYSIACSESSYPNCATPCATVWYCTTSVSQNCAGCTYSEEANNISQSGSGYSIACSESSYPNCATPCATVWYCTTSVSQNCAGCTYSEEANNISSSGSGYSISCSTTSYPNCNTPCTTTTTTASTTTTTTKATTTTSSSTTTTTTTTASSGPCGAGQTAVAANRCTSTDISNDMFGFFCASSSAGLGYCLTVGASGSACVVCI